MSQWPHAWHPIENQCALVAPLNKATNFPFFWVLETNDLGMTKMRNIIPRAGFEPPLLVIPGIACHPFHNLGSLLQSPFPHLSAHVAPCLSDQCILVQFTNDLNNNFIYYINGTHWSTIFLPNSATVFRVQWSNEYQSVVFYWTFQGPINDRNSQISSIALKKNQYWNNSEIYINIRNWFPSFISFWIYVRYWSFMFMQYRKSYQDGYQLVIVHTNDYLIVLPH